MDATQPKWPLVILFFALTQLAESRRGYELICYPYEELCCENADVSHISFRQIQVATLNLSKKPKKAQQLPT